MQSIYILTLSTATAARVANSTTSWTLAKRDKDEIVASGVSVDDPHGDRARADGRAAARKHANSLSRSFATKDVQVRYRDRPPRVPAPGPSIGS